MTIQVDIQFKRGDIPRAIRRFGIARKDLEQIMRDSGVPFGTRVLNQSDAIVPVKFGNLKATGAVLGPQRVAGGALQVQLKYGGSAARNKALPRPDVLGPDKVDYALMQHETNARSKGFLVRPFLANRNLYFRLVSRAFNRFFALKARSR